MVINHSLNVNFKKEAFLMLGFLFIYVFNVSSQDMNYIDSLETSYLTRKYDKNEQLSILKILSYDHPVPEKALKYSEELIIKAKLTYPK